MSAHNENQTQSLNYIGCIRRYRGWLYLIALKAHKYSPNNLCILFNTDVLYYLNENFS